MSENNVVKLHSKYVKKYKCPYCEKRLERQKLVSHIEKYHDEMIPENYTATRVVFNLINKKTQGCCVICGKETKWNEDKARYERICENPKCKKAYIDQTAERLYKKHGKTKEDFLKDPEFQEKMLANRSISGKYKFQDGGVLSYVGSYEKNFLKFMDQFFHIKSSDLLSPGPVIEYQYNGKTHKWITDFYYEPYNLVFDIKDGGDNPNNRRMDEYREKQIAKEKAIQDLKQYNYIRLTNNQFDQMIELMMELKENLTDTPVKTTRKVIVRINEGQTKPEEGIHYNTYIFDIGSVLVQYDDIKHFLVKNDKFPKELVDYAFSVWLSYETQRGSLLDQMRSTYEKLSSSIYYSRYGMQVKEVVSKIAELSVKNVIPCDYTLPLIKRLKARGCKVYYLSNWNKWHFEAIRHTSLSFLDFFDGGIVSYETGTQKPDLKIYQLLIDKYGIDPYTAVFYDDKQENIEAAKKVGLQAVQFDRNIADYLINNI